MKFFIEGFFKIQLLLQLSKEGLVKKIMKKGRANIPYSNLPELLPINILVLIGSRGYGLNVPFSNNL